MNTLFLNPFHLIAHDYVAKDRPDIAPDLLGVYDNQIDALRRLDEHLEAGAAALGTDYMIKDHRSGETLFAVNLSDEGYRQLVGIEVQIKQPDAFDRFLLVSHQNGAGNAYEEGDFVHLLGSYQNAGVAFAALQAGVADESEDIKYDLFLLGQSRGQAIEVNYDGQPEPGTGKLLHAAYARYDEQENRYVYRQVPKPQLITINNNSMIEKNVKYLAEQVKFSGFGEKLGEEIKQQIEQKPDKFQLRHDTEINNQKVSAVLDFSRSKQGEMYFFNKYQLTLTPESGGAAMTQQIYIQQKGQSLTLKEAYNMMNGRAVYKPELANKQGEKYAAWVKLDFKEQDGAGGFKLKPYGENYGFKLEEALAKHPIMELVSVADKEKLIASLEKGNRVAVTYNLDGKNGKRLIEASPTSHGLNIFDEQQRLIKQPWTPKQEQSKTQDQAQKADQAQKQEKRKSQKVS